MDIFLDLYRVWMKIEAVERVKRALLDAKSSALILVE